MTDELELVRQYEREARPCMPSPPATDAIDLALRHMLASHALKRCFRGSIGGTSSNLLQPPDPSRTHGRCAAVGGQDRRGNLDNREGSGGGNSSSLIGSLTASIMMS